MKINQSTQSAMKRAVEQAKARAAAEQAAAVQPVGTPEKPQINPGVAQPVIKGPQQYVEAKEKINEIKDLRSDLDAGKIDVETFVNKGKTLATEVDHLANVLTTQGQSIGRTYGEPLWQELKPLGFDTWATNTSIVRGSEKPVLVKLPEKHQQQLRESLIPSNITGEAREKMLKEIPLDIDVNSDRFNIEREGVRQKVQIEDTAKTQSDMRSTRLQDLSKLLAQQKTQTFERNKGALAEDAMARGLFKTSGYGDSLARYQTQLDQDTTNLLATQGLADRDLDINALATALQTQQTFQGSGLSREFSTGDAAKQFQDALRFAQMTQPQQKSGKGGAGGAFTGAVSGMGAGAALGPWGAAAGGVLGGIGGGLK